MGMLVLHASGCGESLPAGDKGRLHVPKDGGGEFGPNGAGASAKHDCESKPASSGTGAESSLRSLSKNA